MTDPTVIQLLASARAAVREITPPPAIRVLLLTSEFDDYDNLDPVHLAVNYDLVRVGMRDAYDPTQLFRTAWQGEVLELGIWAYEDGLRGRRLIERAKREIFVGICREAVHEAAEFTRDVDGLPLFDPHARHVTDQTLGLRLNDGVLDAARRRA